MPNGQVISSYPSNSELLFVGSKQLLLLDKSNGVDVGTWMPWAPYHKGSFEVRGTFIGTVKLWLSNAQDQPINGSEILIAGTPHAGDIITFTAYQEGLNGGFLRVAYTVKNTDSTVTKIRDGLLAAMQAAFAQANNTLENYLAASVLLIAGKETDKIDVTWAYPTLPFFFTIAVTGPSATTAAALSQIDDGQGYAVTGCTLTAPSLVQFDAIGTWIKSSVPLFTSGDITAIVQGVTP